MKILVTAGNTQVPIDRVRCITNIFTGRTGAALALEAYRRGHTVHLLTSHPEIVTQLGLDLSPDRWVMERYRTFDDLARLMEAVVRAGEPDAVIHSAAVSDYRFAGVYAPAAGSRFNAEECRIAGDGKLIDRSAGKVKSDEPELWLRLVRAPKLVDLLRTSWSFAGILVKFKLEVGLDDEQLLEVAERSRQHSSADLMVANTLEGSSQSAWLGRDAEEYRKVDRRGLPAAVLEEVEAIARERQHG